MGIAGLILGIIGLIIGWIPILCVLGFVLSIIGLILSILDVTKKNKVGNQNFGNGLAGIIISAIAFMISAIMSFASIIILEEVLNNSNDINDLLNEYEDSYYNRYYDDYYNYDDYYDFYHPFYNDNLNKIEWQ